jgi:hypothetical protein
MSDRSKEYLGDGVYAEYNYSFNGEVRLTTENGIEISNEILLDPDVVRSFLAFLQRHAKKAG